MRKSILSAYLMGAIALATTSTFVSCKDYDDDITSLQEQIDKLNANQTTIDALKAAFDKGVVITSVTSNADGLVVTTSDGNVYNIKNGKDGATGATGATGAAGVDGKDGKDAVVWTIGTDGYWYQDGVKTDYKAIGTDGKDGVNGTDGKDGKDGVNGTDGKDGKDGKDGVNGTDGKDGDVYTPGTDGYWYKNGVKTDQSWKANVLTAVVAGDQVIFSNFDDKGTTVAVPTVLKLKSMVFDAKNYWKGIEAITVNTYNYAALNLNAADVTKDQVAGNKDYKDAAAAATASKAQFYATYFLNPANAKVSTDAALYNYVCNEAFTRSTGDYEGISIAQVQNNAGKLKVKGYVADVNKLQNGTSKVTVIALQYKDGSATTDTIITSDFAAVEALTIEDFSIANTELHEAAPKDHLYLTAEEAAAGDAMFTLIYKEDTLDLDKTINAHAKINGEEALFGYQKDLADLDFKLVYEPIGYVVGGVQQSAIVSVNEDRLAVNDQKIKYVGYTPMLRVTLVDTANNKVVARGYTKIEIVGNVQDVDDTKEVAYTIDCNSSAANPVVKATYLSKAQVEDKLMSVTEFESKWALEMDGAVAVQYEKDAAGAYKKLAADKRIGEVKATTTGDDYIEWGLDNATAYATFTTTTKTSTIVKYSNGTADPIYVTIEMTVPAVVATPAIAIVDADKVVTSWFKNNSLNNGFDELHAHVQEAAGGHTDKFEINLSEMNWRKGNATATPEEVVKAKLESIENLKSSVVNSAVVGFYFTKPTVSTVKGAKGVEYNLSVNDAKTELIATAADNSINEVVATIEPATGKITYNKTPIAQDVLNYEDHKKLGNGETFTARVGVSCDLCEPVKVAVSGNEFDVKFLRPISFSNKEAEITDSDPSTYTAEVELTFEDWRNWDPTTFNTKTGYNFFEYYNVTAIEQDNDRKVETNYVAGGDNFAPAGQLIPNYFEISFSCTVDNTSNTQVGTITYKKNNTEALHTFKLKVPVILTYEWGKLYSYVVVTVKGTTGGNSVKGQK